MGKYLSGIIWCHRIATQNWGSLGLWIALEKKPKSKTRTKKQTTKKSSYTDHQTSRGKFFGVHKWNKFRHSWWCLTSRMWNRWFPAITSSLCFPWMCDFIKLLIWLFPPIPAPRVRWRYTIKISKYKNYRTEWLYKHQSESPRSGDWKNNSNWPQDDSKVCFNKYITAN